MTEPVLPPRFDRLLEYIPYHAQRTPDRLALVGDDRALTWSGLDQLSDRFGRALIKNGVNVGDRVAAWFPPSVEGLLLFISCLRVGAMFVGINPKAKLPELHHIFADSTPTLVFAFDQTDERDYSPDIERFPETGFSNRCIVLAHGGDANASLEQFLAEGDVLEAGVLKQRQETIEPSAPATMVYTSGTTGKPKGALLTQFGLAFNYWHTFKARYCEPFRIPAYFPINHLAGLGDVTSLAIVAGGTIFPMEKFVPEKLLSLIERERINYLPGLVTHFQLLYSKADVEAYDLSSLEIIWYGGALVPQDLLDRLHALCKSVVSDFGQTESVGPILWLTADASDEQKTRTLGRIIDPYQVRLADYEGNPPARGEPGEIQVRGEYLSPGYFNNPDASRALYTEDGWLRTGDIGLERDDGYFEIAGRIKEMFKSGGYNIFPLEIENALSQCTNVDLVAVVSIADTVFQEVGWAFVTPQKGCDLNHETLMAELRPLLSGYKIPKRIVICKDFVPLPMASNQVLKRLK